jgi:site-specific DNA-methyltransferase (adenine-specific)
VAVSLALLNQDCFDAFADLPDASVDSIITDPPYFLDKLGDEWNVDGMAKRTKSTRVKSLPVGMKFDTAQGRAFQEFMGRISTEALRVLKPGGFFLSFSSPRLYHRLAVAVEDAGFEVRDMWAWLYTQNQVKAMSIARFLDASGLTRDEERRIREELAVWKTPQVKSCLEPIVFAQKPKLDSAGRPLTFLENWLEHGVGLVNTRTGAGSEGNMVTANVMTTGPIESSLDKAFLVSKPSKMEKGQTSHISVKPLALMEQLIQATTPEGGLVLDPFNGSGSTGIAAIHLRRSYIGFELAPEYFAQSRTRFLESLKNLPVEWDEEDKALRARGILG